jgi:hypothetical protein
MDGKDGPNLCRFDSERHTCNILYYTRKERMKKLLALLIFVPAVGHAQTVTPNFTQGSMQATTTTTTTIDRVIETEVMGGAYSSWSGTNITPSGDITGSQTTFSVHTAGDPFQLEITTRAAGKIEDITITEDIDINSTTTSLSVFSQ